MQCGAADTRHWPGLTAVVHRYALGAGPGMATGAMGARERCDDEQRAERAEDRKRSNVIRPPVWIRRARRARLESSRRVPRQRGTNESLVSR